MNNSEIFSIDEINESNLEPDTEENFISKNVFNNFQEHFKNLNFEYNTKMNNYLENLKHNLYNIEKELIKYYENKLIECFEENKNLKIILNDYKIKNKKFENIIINMNKNKKVKIIKKKFIQNFDKKSNNNKYIILKYFYKLNKNCLVNKYEDKINKEIFKASKIFNKSLLKLNKNKEEKVIKTDRKFDFPLKINK